VVVILSKGKLADMIGGINFNAITNTEEQQKLLDIFKFI
jgi:hypothetical protein